jgi:hypothetical protein
LARPKRHLGALPDTGKSATLAAKSGRKPLRDNEYERLRRDIEERLAADLELIHAAHQARLEALDALRLASAHEESSRPEPPASVPHTDVPAPPVAAVKRQRGDLLTEVLKIFSDLPEIFDKSDVARLLGYEPNRPGLHRVWDKLRSDKKIAIESFSTGRSPTRYRRVG